MRVKKKGKKKKCKRREDECVQEGSRDMLREMEREREMKMCALVICCM